ncbi:Ca(2+)-dependent cysteine protease [Clydaea vesicula]|uniref:Ca(2+)-dependent cysteine protease n=1 Tax=Clydaea vesicula TaxID=447962 RepID=A0AAD5XYW5_9FUNG|nr:Ca(2+)-dependent cysteine protease [Clydaea vesicula]
MTGKIQIVFLGFHSTTNTSSSPAQRILTVLPKHDTKTITEYLNEIRKLHFKDCQSITENAIKNSAIYTGPPDFWAITASDIKKLPKALAELNIKDLPALPTSKPPQIPKLQVESINKNVHKSSIKNTNSSSNFVEDDNISIASLASQGKLQSVLQQRLPRKKVLLIGINYFGQPDVELKGCINDVKNMYKLVTTRWGYKNTPEEMKILTDEKDDPKKLPTKANMLEAFKWLMEDVQAGDSLYIHYSGHGSQQEEDGDDYEEDGMDDTLVPLDFQENGQIVDDDLNDLLVKSLPEGAKLTVFMDCCHSGTILDLPYTFDKNGTLSNDPKMGLLGASKGEIVMISGCMETQTSADAKIAGMATGAMSYALLKTIQDKGAKISGRQLLESIRVHLITIVLPVVRIILKLRKFKLREILLITSTQFRYTIAILFVISASQLINFLRYTMALFPNEDLILERGMELGVSSHYYFNQQNDIPVYNVIGYANICLSGTLVIFMVTNRYKKLEMVLQNSKKDKLIRYIRIKVLTIRFINLTTNRLSIQYTILKYFIMYIAAMFLVIDLIFNLKMIKNVLRIPNPENRKRQVVVKTKLYLIMLTSVVLDSASTLLYLYSPKMGFVNIGAGLAYLHLYLTTLILELIYNYNKELKNCKGLKKSYINIFKKQCETSVTSSPSNIVANEISNFESYVSMSPSAISKQIDLSIN